MGGAGHPGYEGDVLGPHPLNYEQPLGTCTLSPKEAGLLPSRVPKANRMGGRSRYRSVERCLHLVNLARATSAVPDLPRRGSADLLPMIECEGKGAGETPLCDALAVESAAEEHDRAESESKPASSESQKARPSRRLGPRPHHLDSSTAWSTAKLKQSLLEVVGKLLHEQLPPRTTRRAPGAGNERAGRRRTTTRAMKRMRSPCPWTRMRGRK